MTTALNMIRGRSNVVTLTNNSGGSLVAGDVCVQDTSISEGATTTTSAASLLKVFIASESISSGSAGRFYESGYVPLVNVNASVTNGHFLFTHTVAKQATGSVTYAGGAFGKILTGGTAPTAILYSATAQTAGTGNVASVGLSLPNTFTVSNSPVTTSGTLTGAWATTPANGSLLTGNGSTYVSNNLVAGSGITITNSSGSVTIAGSSSTYLVAGGRLTLESGVPVSSTDQANKTTLYYTFYKGDQIGLYNGSAWNVRTFTEQSLAVGAFTASKPYDIWLYDNAGVPTLDSTVWTNATTRATALAYQNGILVKSGDATRRYIGTIYIDSGQKVQDTAGFRYVANFYNTVQRPLRYYDATASWTYGTAAYRFQNNNSAFLVGFVCCGADTFVRVENSLDMSGGTAYASQGLDKSNGIDGTQVATSLTSAMRLTSFYQGSPGIGYHYISAVEYVGSGTGTYYGNSASGLFGIITI